MDNLLALRAGQVFDGERPLGPAMVLVEKGAILDVDATGAAPPEVATVVDFGPDTCLLPGLIDAHVHLTFDASDDVVGALDERDDDALLSIMEAGACSALRAGVTTVRDLGDRNYLTLALRERLAGSGPAGPHIVAAGPPITTRGGHCHFLGGEAEGEAELRAAVRERAERGCDVIKVMVSGGNITPGSKPHESQYDLAALRAIVEEAHRLGLPAAGHVHAAGAVRDAVEAGFDTLEHVTFFTADGVGADPAVMERIAREGIVVSVTAGNAPGHVPRVPAIVQRLEAILANHRRMRQAGAVMIPGTDAGLGPGKPIDVLPYGVAALVELGGMSPEDALRAATSVAAGAIGLAGRKGRLIAGADADVIAVGGNPFADVGALTEVKAVYRAGERVR